MFPVCALVFLAVWTWAVHIEPKMLVTERYRISVSGVDRPRRIVLLSDLHLHGAQSVERLRDLEEAVRRIARSEAPVNMVILAGDILEDGHDAPFIAAELARILEPLAPAERRIYVPGNHEREGLADGRVWDVVAPRASGYYDRLVKNDTLAIEGTFARAGFRVLADRTEVIDGIGVVGLRYTNAVTRTPAGQREIDALSAPAIVVAHSPDQLFGLPPSVIAAFAGHTHGGQVTLPFIGALVTATQSDLPRPAGLMRIGSTPTVVTRGVSQSINLRLGAPPEISIVDLATR